MKRLTRRGICVLFAAAVIVSSLMNTVKVVRADGEDGGSTAVTGSSTPILILEGYEVSNEKIVPGEDFALKLTIKNISDSVDAKGVIINIENPDGVYPVYGTVSQLYVGTVKAGQSATAVFDYNSLAGISDDVLSFFVTFINNQPQNYIELRIPTGTDSPFSLVNCKFPETVTENTATNASITFKVLGNENVSNVSLGIWDNGSLLTSTLIGILTPGVTKTQSIAFNLDTPGVHTMSMVLKYTDASGQEQSVELGLSNITVEAKAEQEPATDNETPSGNDKAAKDSKIVLLGISSVLILVIFMLVVIILRRQK